MIPRTGTLKTTDSLDSLGFFVSHMDSLLPVFNSLRVSGPNYPISHAALTDLKRQTRPTDRPLKVGLFRTHTWGEASDYARNAILEWAESLNAPRVRVVEVEPPAGMELAHEIHSTIYDSALAYYFKEEAKRKELVSPILQEIIERGKRVTGKEYEQALKAQEKLVTEMDSLMQNYDVGISLSTAGEAPLREDPDRPDPALLWTLVHLPVVSAPLFVSPTGLPFGAQLFARKYNDLLLLRVLEHLRDRGLVPERSNRLPKTRFKGEKECL